MRLRRLTVLSVAAVSALLLAGCSGTTEAPAEETSSALCAGQAASGEASESVTVEGAVGEAAAATFEAPLEVSELQVTTLEEGDGDQIAVGDFIAYTLTAYDAESGEELTSMGYEPGQILPTQITEGTVFSQVFGCSTVGSRVVAAFPADETVASEVYVLDLLSVVPTAAWGEEQEPVEGMPTVELAEDGTPTITVPETDAPTETEIAVLTKGDGYEVQEGDNLLIQFRGARWSTGEVFEGGDTWESGSPYIGQMQFIEGFQQAIVGQPVGSQVIVVIPPAAGYGEGEINADDLVGETLVFVIDILGAQTATQTQ